MIVKKARIIALALFVFISITFAVSGVYAQAPCIPNRFYGDVVVNGKPAPDNLNVTARINGVLMASTITRDGKYGYSPYTFDVPDNDNNCENTATIEFFVEGKPAGEAVFENGKVTYLKLSASGIEWCGDGSCNNDETCSSCPRDCGACPSGNSGGGGSDGGTGGGYVPPAQSECVPDWQCSPWSQCIGGSQTRECTDANSCNTTEGKPAETQDCGIKKILPGECTEGETTCVGNDVWKCKKNSEWEKIDTCETQCIGGSCSNAANETGSEAINATEGGGSEGEGFTGLISLDRTSLIYIASLIVVILLLIYALSRGRKKTGKEKQ